MALGDEFKSSGITDKTPKSIMLGAGTIHKGLVFGYTVLTSQPSDWTTGYANYYSRSGSEGNYTYTVLNESMNWKADTYYKKGWK